MSRSPEGWPDPDQSAFKMEKSPTDSLEAKDKILGTKVEELLVLAGVTSSGHEPKTPSSVDAGRKARALFEELAQQLPTLAVPDVHSHGWTRRIVSLPPEFDSVAMIVVQTDVTDESYREENSATYMLIEGVIEDELENLQTLATQERDRYDDLLATYRTALETLPKTEA